MPMKPFYTRFHDLAFREMRTLIVQGHGTLPDGSYGFLEFYCDEAGCDCRRVVFHVTRPDTGDRVWASINFGWESPAHYKRWSPKDPEFDQMAGAILDPLNPQSEVFNACGGGLSDVRAEGGAEGTRKGRRRPDHLPPDEPWNMSTVRIALSPWTRSAPLLSLLGPLVPPAPAGEQVGPFNSIWRRDEDGEWRVVFDRGCKSHDGGSA